MDEKAIIEHFKQQIVNTPQFSTPEASIKTMIKVVEMDTSITYQGFLAECQQAIKILTEFDPWSTSINSAAEIFLRFITKANLFGSDFNDCRKIMLKRGQEFLKNLLMKQEILEKYGVGVIKKSRTILVHGKSPRVFSILKKAKDKQIQFRLFVTKGLANSGAEMVKWLEEINIKSELIEDCHIAHYATLAKVVLIGAETICDIGGVLSPIGSFPVALAAVETKTPLYICVEAISYSLSTSPSNQSEVWSQIFKTPNNNVSLNEVESPLSQLDYIPPNLITHYISEYGIQANIVNLNDLPGLYLC